MSGVMCLPLAIFPWLSTTQPVAIYLLYYYNVLRASNIIIRFFDHFLYRKNLSLSVLVWHFDSCHDTSKVYWFGSFTRFLYNTRRYLSLPYACTIPLYLVFVYFKTCCPNLCIFLQHCTGFLQQWHPLCEWWRECCEWGGWVGSCAWRLVSATHTTHLHNPHRYSVWVGVETIMLFPIFFPYKIWMQWNYFLLHV